MKIKKPGLAAQLSFLLALAGAVGVLLFCSLYFGGRSCIEHYFEDSNFQEHITEKRISNLQEYVKKYNLSTKDTAQLTRWVKKQPLILMEIYRSNILLYTSSAPDKLIDGQNEMEAPYYDWVSYYHISFADGMTEVAIYADDTYRWFNYLTIGSLVLALLLFLFIFLRGCRGLVRYICQLCVEIQAMEGGDLDVPITLKGDHELTNLAKSLNSMRFAFKEQREREVNIFRSNQTMITEMSHDLRTPLTTLQIYTDILRYKKYDPSKLDDYLEKIDAKACQIKQLSENIFEYSLVSKHQMICLGNPESFREVFHDVLSEAVAYLGQKGFTFDLGLEWPKVEISVYAQYVKRLIDNVASNIIKYADPSTPIQIKTLVLDGAVNLSFRNAAQNESTKQDGAHIGISNMQTMMEKMNGLCLITHTEKIFEVEFRFPIC